MQLSVYGRELPVGLLLNDLPLLSAKQPFKKQKIKGYELLLPAYSVEKLGCKTSDIATRILMRGLRSG